MSSEILVANKLNYSKSANIFNKVDYLYDVIHYTPRPLISTFGKTDQSKKDFSLFDYWIYDQKIWTTDDTPYKSTIWNLTKNTMYFRVT